MASTQSHYIPGFVGRNLHPSCYMDHPVLSTNSTICWPQYPHKIPLDSNFSLLFLDGLKSFTYWTAIFSNFISPFYPHDSWWHLYFSHQISHITIIPWNPHLIARSSFMLFAHSIDNFSASTMWNLHNLHIFPYHTSFPWFSHDFPVISHDFPMIFPWKSATKKIRVRIAKTDHVSFGSSAQRFGDDSSEVPPPGAYDVEAEVYQGAVGKDHGKTIMEVSEMMT